MPDTIIAVTVITWICGISEIWIFGYAENDPRHITRFQSSIFEIWKSQHFLKNVDNLD